MAGLVSPRGTQLGRVVTQVFSAQPQGRTLPLYSSSVGFAMYIRFALPWVQFFSFVLHIFFPQASLTSIRQKEEEDKKKRYLVQLHTHKEKKKKR